MIRVIHSKKFMVIRSEIFEKLAPRNKCIMIAQQLNEALELIDSARSGAKGINDQQVAWLRAKCRDIAEELTVRADRDLLKDQALADKIADGKIPEVY